MLMQVVSICRLENMHLLMSKIRGLGVWLLLALGYKGGLLFYENEKSKEVDSMNINPVINNGYNRTNIMYRQNALDRYKETYKLVSPKMDSLEISSEAYELRNNDERISATSGKDTLGITKGDKENTYVIHFSDSAMVSRAISRGYITVNGVDIELSDEVKKQLTNVNKQAQADREKAYNEYIMQHELAVAKQQSEALSKAYGDMSEAFEIAAKISKGGKVSSQEAKKLMEMNPDLYAMAMAAAAMSEKRAEQSEIESINEEGAENISNETVKGVSWSDFDWKSYETRMTILMEKTPVIEGVAEGEISLS